MGMMAAKTATCQCGAVRVTCEGNPVRVSVCHCLDCQQRSGSAFAAQARFPVERVTISGETRVWTRINDNGARANFHFCPNCGSGVWYELKVQPGVIAVPIGNFAEVGAFELQYSVWEVRKQPWVEVPGANVEHFD